MATLERPAMEPLAVYKIIRVMSEGSGFTLSKFQGKVQLPVVYAPFYAFKAKADLIQPANSLWRPKHRGDDAGA